MPSFETRNFGSINYEADSVITFPAGLPGFEQERNFVALDFPANRPLVFLQSLLTANLCFIAVPTNIIEPNYRVTVESEDAERLGLEPGQGVPGPEVLILALISVSENEIPSANLLAPVVLNLKTRKAAQVIMADSGYSHRQPLGEGA